MNYPQTFSPFTDDEIERQQLEATYVEPTSASDPYHEEIQNLSHQLSTAARSLKPLHRKIVESYYRGDNKAEIIKELHTTYATVNLAIHSPKGVRLFALYTQLAQLRGGPALEARRAMLWRIARRAETKAPSVALKAIDILNKQSGDYVPEEAQEVGLQVVVKNFTINHLSPPTPTPTIKDVTPLTGEFKPVIVEIPDA